VSDGSPRKVWPAGARRGGGHCARAVRVTPGELLAPPVGGGERPHHPFARDDRSTLYRQAVGLIDNDELRGAGAGAFSGVNRAEYPHNIFLELWAELGIIAVAVMAAAIVSVLMG
jgi:hypothetical protein